MDPITYMNNRVNKAMNDVFVKNKNLVAATDEELIEEFYRRMETDIKFAEKAGMYTQYLDGKDNKAPF